MITSTTPASGPPPADVPGEHPLSEGQRALWFLDRLDPGAAACHLAGAARVLGGLDPEAVRRALAILSARHPALRTTFETREGEPVRRVHAGLAPDFAAGSATDGEIPGLLAAEAFRRFEMERAPLWRVRVWSLGSGDAVLLVALHHLIADFASVSILLRDLVALLGETASLAAPGSGMTAWIARREKALAGDRGEQLRAWWHARLAGELPALELPVDRPRPASPSWRGVARTIRLDGAAEALRGVGRAQGATLYATLLAGLQAVLQRWTGQDEVLIGAPTAGRGPGFGGEIGYFVRVVLLRLGRGEEASFADLVGRAGSTVREALAHAEYPFPRLARELGAGRDETGRSLFGAMLVLQPGRTPEERALAPFALGEPGGRAEVGALSLESMALPEERVQTDLTLMAAETEGGGLALSLRLDADLFDAVTAERLLGHLGTFLRAVAADPECPVQGIEILSETEHLQLSTWSAGPFSPPPGPCLHELIAEQAARTPEAVALVHDESELTYAELRRRATGLAAHLRGMGVGPEVRVGVCARRTPELVTGLLAVLEAGGAYVPLDPAYPAERLALLLEDSGAALLLTDRDSADRLPVFDIPRVRIDALAEGTPASSFPDPRRPSPENLAYLIYTSGSTGRPKAVAIEHRSAVALALWARDAFPGRSFDGVLASTSVGFDLSVFELLVPLCHGGRIVLAGNVLDLPELPASAGVRLVNTVPSAMAELLAAKGLPPSVETVNLAGEPLRRELVRALFEAGVRRVVNLYGPSEDTTYSTIADSKQEDRGEPSIGRPVAGTRARVLDRRMGPVPPGVIGELFLGGAGLARGYLGRPELTAERFVPSPFAEDGAGARLYRTGDRVRFRQDGELLFLGRLDHQVKIRGFRIEPGEVEAALVECPGVEQAVVLPVGEGGGRRLVGYVVAEPLTPWPPLPSHPPDRERGNVIRAFLSRRIPEHMIPSSFVFLESFPRTPNGKVDRKALAALGSKQAGPAVYEAPRTPLEVALAEVWREVLEVERVGVQDDFFELGGHSLLAVRVQARVRERLEVDLPLPAVFRSRTVAGLARLVETASPLPDIPPPVPRPRDGSAFPLSFAQERFWLLHRMDPASPAYHLAAEVRITGLLEVGALGAGLREVARCHEALRTRFVEGPLQILDPDWLPALPLVSFDALPPAHRTAEADRLTQTEARRPFDLAAAPPVRATLLRLSPDDHRLLLTLHHVAADEASLAILARDLGAAYAAFSQGQPSPLVPLPIQIADVAVWQRERMQGAAFEERLAWWEERLSGVPRLDLPGGPLIDGEPGSGVRVDASMVEGAVPPGDESPGYVAAPPEGGFKQDRGGLVSTPLPMESLGALSRLARREEATLYMALLAGFQVFLSRLTGALDFAVGSPFSTRGARHLEGVVGPLLNTLVVRADLSGDPSFRAILGRVREETIAAHERADVPFELLSSEVTQAIRVLFVLHRPPVPFGAGGVEMVPRPVFPGAAKFDLTLFALERGDGIELALEHAFDLWDGATAARWLERIVDLLAEVAGEPDRVLSALPLLADPERRAVIHAPRPRVTPVASVGPRTPIEELLTGIWEDVLGIERPGLHDDFFALGGQSLLGARVVARLREPLGVDLPLRTLFEARTIAGLSARVDAARGTGFPETPLVPVPREDFPTGLPLSFGQERLWFMDRLDPESAVYNLPGAVRLSGLLNPAALEKSIAGIVDRHEILRTTFPAPGGTPVQVAAPFDLALPLVDLSGLAPESRRTEALRLASVEALRPFDLQAGPLIRTTLLRLDAAEHVLLVTVHHIVFDGWSMGVFLHELAEPSSPSALQYADFAVWQRRRLDGGVLEPHIAWWRDTLEGAPPVLPLPFDRPRLPIQTFGGGSRRMTLRPEVARALRDLSRRLEATPFMVLLAAWAALLARSGAGSDLVVGTAVAGRGRVELERMIGLFAENLVLRLDLGRNPTFSRLVARARETTLAAWAHQEVPFERLVRELRPERDLSHAPLYQTALTLDASDRPPLELPGLRLELLPVESGTAKLDLALYLEDRQGEISGLLEYNRDLFDATTADRLLAAFERLAEAVPREPERRISQLPVLSAAERHQVLHELTGASPITTPPLVLERIEAHAKVTPEALAVSAMGGKGETLSYGELDRRAERLAGRLRELGVGPEVRVAVRLDRSPELIVAMLGIWKAGGVYVPLDPTHPEERLEWIVGDCGAAVVVTEETMAASPDPHPRVPGTGTAGPLHAAYLIYTSGSTGRPKGVVVSHAALATYAASVAGLYGVGPGDRVLQNASVAFDLSLDEILPALIGGAELVLRDDALISSVATFLDGCREREITVLILPTAYLHEIAARLEAEDLALPPSLRLVSTGGERLLPERLAAWRRRFSGPLFNTYGPTEATIQVTGVNLNAPGRAGRTEAPIGRPLPGAGVWLLDGRGDPVPPGVAGEVCLGGPLLARGYLGQPDRTAERFVPHPFPPAPGDRLYRTGDLARFLPDGLLEFAGRIDDQIKVRGYRVEPGEVEAVLTGHPGVEAAAVIAWDDGSGRKRLIGYVVPRSPASSPETNAAELRAFLSASLPEPLIPAELIFLEAMPLTPHGKVDRRALPAPSGQGAGVEHVAPRDETEQAVAAIWREALGVEKVGVHDNFFDLGGHSLVLARVHVLLRERLGREVSMVDLFRSPTVAALARRLSDTAPPPPPVAPQIQERGERSRTATRQGRFLEARKRMAATTPASPPPVPSPPNPLSHTPSHPPGEGAPPPKDRNGEREGVPPLPGGGEGVWERGPGGEGSGGAGSPQAAFLRFAERNPEALERASFAELDRHDVGSPYPLQPWPALVDRARVAEMKRVSTGIAALIRSLPRRVFGNDPERLRDFYGLAGADLARLMVQHPDGLAATIGRGDFLDSAEGLKCLEFNMLSALGGWEAPLWAEAYLRVPVFARFLREERLRVACRDTVALLLAHAVAEARELGTADGEINVALVTPEHTASHGHHLESWLAGRYAEALRREAPGASGTLVILPYAGLRERAGALWAGERRIHAAVELHEEGTAAQALRCFRAGTLKLFNAPIRVALTDKRNLALLSELAERGDLLNPAERELAARHVPWTRRLTADSAVRRGAEVWLPEMVLAEREELVIKKARAGRGSAVHLGAATPEALWSERVERALAEGDWIVQERVEPLPAIHQHGERGAGPHDVVWGLFALGDRYGGGFLSLAHREARTQREGGVINVMRGATVGVIFEVLNDE
jgi:amino acid adenylation domain-containing protein